MRRYAQTATKTAEFQDEVVRLYSPRTRDVAFRAKILVGFRGCRIAKRRRRRRRENHGVDGSLKTDERREGGSGRGVLIQHGRFCFCGCSLLGFCALWGIPRLCTYIYSMTYVRGLPCAPPPPAPPPPHPKQRRATVALSLALSLADIFLAWHPRAANCGSGFVSAGL